MCRWLLQEGRKACQPDGAHPEALPAARRGRRALRFAAPRQQEADAHPAATAGSTDSKAHSNMAGSAGGEVNSQQPAITPSCGNDCQQPSSAKTPAERLVQRPAADPQRGVRIGDASSGGQSVEADDAWQAARQEAEEEYGADEEGPEGASDEEAALERKSPADGVISRCAV